MFICTPVVKLRPSAWPKGSRKVSLFDSEARFQVAQLFWCHFWDLSSQKRNQISFEQERLCSLMLEVRLETKTLNLSNEAFVRISSFFFRGRVPRNPSHKSHTVCQPLKMVSWCSSSGFRQKGVDVRGGMFVCLLDVQKPAVVQVTHRPEARDPTFDLSISTILLILAFIS